MKGCMYGAKERTFAVRDKVLFDEWRYDRMAEMQMSTVSICTDLLGQNYELVHSASTNNAHITCASVSSIRSSGGLATFPLTISN